VARALIKYSTGYVGFFTTKERRDENHGQKEKAVFQLRGLPDITHWCQWSITLAYAARSRRPDRTKEGCAEGECGACAVQCGYPRPILREMRTVTRVCEFDRRAAALALERWHDEECPAVAAATWLAPATSDFAPDTAACMPNFAYGYVAEMTEVTANTETGAITVNRVGETGGHRRIEPC
jgi:hypothetical protein